MRLGLIQDQIKQIIDNHFGESELLSKEQVEVVLIDVITRNNEQILSDLPRVLDEISRQKKRVSLN